MAPQNTDTVTLELLIADDDADFCESLRSITAEQGWKATVATTTDDALAHIERRADRLDAILLDIEFRGEERTGMDVLEQTRKRYPWIPVVMISGKGTLETAVRATKLGAENFLDKASVTTERLVEIVRQAARRPLAQNERELSEFLLSQGIVARSTSMLKVAEQILRYGRSKLNVLITGETGTGKQLVARALHNVSPRNKKPFVRVDIPNIPDTLFQSEMFGYVRGAFTGAAQDRPGYFHAANRGTLFLDEIGDLRLELQASLLVPIEEGRFHRVGSTEEEHADIRIISATDRDLVEAVNNKQFREQLYYRIREAEIKLPPLRERPDDIPLIAAYTLQQLNETSTIQKSFTPLALDYLTSLSWKGNVRELISVIRSAYTHTDDSELITERTLAEIVRTAYPTTSVRERAPDFRTTGTLGEITAAAEKEAIVRTLEQSHGNVSRAAAMLGVSRETLYSLMREYSINPNSFRPSKQS
ncbi:MAG: sigma-54 dependent transcriptional regulator [Chlorobi bacterium]|nr:sigma-54 dependent transcriptional regulator [Chlorobiota bacterium]